MRLPAIASGSSIERNHPVETDLDPITGLPLWHRVAARFDAREANAGAAVIVIGFDGLASVRLELGAAIGDLLLQRVARRTMRALPAGAIISRAGETEFAVLLLDVEPAGAAAKLAELLSRPYLADGQTIQIEATLGVAQGPLSDAEPETLRRYAGLARGRATADIPVCFFTADMARQASERRSLEFDLRKALALREFELFYQPQIDLVSGRLSGFEALLRWRHPGRGLVPPGVFLALTEETGLIVPIGEWALRTACLEAAGWPDDVSVAVNVAGAQFKDGRLVEVVRSALTASGLPAERLDIEVTEGILLREEGAAVATLHALHAMGVHISMDDFGTGYSSITQLKAFPFDKIKIDRSLVTNIARGPSDAIFVRAITMLATGLGMKTMAEGVETEAQLERVRAEGCDLVQGFWFGKPVPASEIPRVLAALHSPVQKDDVG